MTRFLPTVAILSASVLSATLFAAPAMADKMVTQPVTLSYNVLELETSTNADAVLHDLQRQARQACMSITPITRAENIDEVCVADVLEQAVGGIDNAALTAAYEQTNSYRAVAIDADENLQS